MTTIDYDAYYTVKGSEGIAYYLRGPVMVRECDDWGGEEVPHPFLVRAVMVGDDRVHEVDKDDLIPLDEDDFCHGCGQVGCGH